MRPSARPVRLTIDSHAFLQTLVRYAGQWRLYLNGPMRQAAGKQVGNAAAFALAHDPVSRAVPVPPLLSPGAGRQRRRPGGFCGAAGLAPAGNRALHRLAQKPGARGPQRGPRRAVSAGAGAVRGARAAVGTAGAGGEPRTARKFI